MTIAKRLAPPSDVSEARYHLGIAVRFLIQAAEARQDDSHKLAIEMLSLIRDRLTPKNNGEVVDE